MRGREVYDSDDADSGRFPRVPSSSALVGRLLVLGKHDQVVLNMYNVYDEIMNYLLMRRLLRTRKGPMKNEVKFDDWSLRA